MIDLDHATPLLGGLSPRQFMADHWHKQPLLIRGAVPGMTPLLTREALFALADSEQVESRLIQGQGAQWSLDKGPFAPDELPAVDAPNWTLLVQGVDLHDDDARALLERFRFVPDARIDDLMISYASDQGGVGPHFDSYDVFLLQAKGRRRWRIGRQTDLSLRPDMPLKILANFEPEQEFVLEPGDMLYLPPAYAHDGVAEGGDCMTYSIGFRSPSEAELGQEVLLRLGEALAEEEGSPIYRDPEQPAAAEAARMPEGLMAFARQAVARCMDDPDALARALGEYMTEPKANVWFDGEGLPEDVDGLNMGVRLDRRTRMLYDDAHVFVNGESFFVGGRDGDMLRELAQNRALDAAAFAQISPEAREVLFDWIDTGWLHLQDDDHD